MAKVDPKKYVIPSAIVLVLANLVPVFGVLCLHWEVFPLMLIFWMENVIVGVFALLRILLSEPTNVLKWFGKVFMVPFFAFHYGMFTMVHGIFVVALFGGGVAGTESVLRSPGVIWQIVKDQHLVWAVIGLVLSHGFSFGWNYLGRGEYRRASVDQLMTAPYARVVILHVTIILGGMLMMVLKSPAAGLAFLAGLKTVIDLWAHVREREKLAGSSRTETAIPT